MRNVLHFAGSYTGTVMLASCHGVQFHEYYMFFVSCVHLYQYTGDVSNIKKGFKNLHISRLLCLQL